MAQHGFKSMTLALPTLSERRDSFDLEREPWNYLETEWPLEDAPGCLQHGYQFGLSF